MSLTREIKAANEKLCQAIKKNPTIYDRSHPNYRKKTATENSWDMVAEECEENVANCKRRWRRIREEYCRCRSDSPNRSAKMKKFYLQDVLRFLIPHMSISTDFQQDKWKHDSNTEKALNPTNIEDENNKNRQKMDESDYKNSVITCEVQQVTAKEVYAQALPTATEIIDLDDEKETMGKKKEQTMFYIKQASSDSHTLKISKVTDPLQTIMNSEVVQEKNNLNNGAEISVEKRVVDPFVSEELVVLAERRKSKRCNKRGNDKKHQKTSPKGTSAELHGVKGTVMQKPGARITRFQNRRMSISVTSASPMNRGSVDPVNMISVPKGRLSAHLSPRLRQQQNNSGPYEQQDSVLSHLEMLAQTQISSNPIKLLHQNQQIATSTTANQQVVDKLIDNKDNDDSFQGKYQPDSKPSENGNKSNQANTLESNLASSKRSPTNTLQNYSIAVKSPASTESGKSLQDRSVQCNMDDVFTDDDFLNIIRPQMREMNARQKMHFKKKVFQSLMEVFDDATDFPNAGEVQHFNINTPSGFENTTNEELHLLRELVSLVSAAKNTQALQKTNCSGRNSPADAVSTTTTKSTHVHQTYDELGLPRHVIQRVVKVAEGGEGTAASTVNADKRFIYRIVPQIGTKVLVNNSNKNSTTSNTSHIYNIGVNGENFSPMRQLIPGEVPTTNPACTSVLPTTVTNAWSAASAPKFAISNNVIGANNATNTCSLKRIARESAGDAISGLLATNSRSKNNLNTAANVSRLGRRYSVCGLPAAGNTKLGTESNTRTITTLANGLLNSNFVSTANANGVQISLKRRLENQVNSFLTSRGRPSELVKVVGQKAFAFSPKKNAVGQITSDASRVIDFLAPLTPVRNTNTGKLTNRSVQSTSNTTGVCNASNLSSSSSTVTSNSPAKRIAQNAQCNVRHSHQKGLAGSNVLGKALNQVFNDDQMGIAATIAADDFTTVRIKQEDDEVLGM